MFFNILLAQMANPDALPAAEPIEKLVETNVADTAVHSTSILSHLWSGDPIVVMTLWLLIAFSVTCWAIILYKTKQLRSAQKDTQGFWQQFSSLGNITDMIGNKHFRSGPLFEIFSTGQQTMAKIKKATTKTYSDYHRSIVMQKLNQAREEEMHKLEQYVSFLATTASAAPFIGLFGTVWGILTAFMAIGKAGSSSLATVGPFISEALVATAVGLFAAIPAVIAYNFFVNQIKVIGKIVDLFIDDFMIKSEQDMS